MKIVNYIYVLLTMVAGSVLLLGFIALVAIDRTDYFHRRADLAAVQVNVLLDLARGSNHLSEHVAEHFILRDEPLDEIRHGLIDLKNSLQKLRLASEDEVSQLRSRDEVQGEQEDAVRVEKLETLLRLAEKQIDEMLQLEANGKAADATQYLNKKFNSETMRQFESQVTAAIVEERSEALKAKAAADEFLVWIRQLAILATGAWLLAAFAIGYGVIRKISWPVIALAEGANAFASGKLDHRIKITSNDELGVLAKRFNEMAEVMAASKAAQLESQAELERGIEERTADFRQKAIELDKANSQLSHVNKNRTQFLADISHEVRTPLTTLRGEAELALRSKVQSPKPYRLALQKILSVSETIGKLVDDLLFLARSETDSLRFDKQSVNLTEMSCSVLEDASILAKTKNIVIRKMFDEQLLVRIEGDPTRIRQALLIALDNAIKYSPPEKNVDFVMSASDQTADFIIRDFGPGVAPEDLPFVFERFYRSKHEAGLPGGFGLGLSIAKWIVDKHGGTISLQCQKSVQTELKISIPLIHAARRAKD
jgi:two-component system, OmpR family, sensor kinase